MIPSYALAVLALILVLAVAKWLYDGFREVGRIFEESERQAQAGIKRALDRLSREDEG